MKFIPFLREMISDGEVYSKAIKGFNLIPVKQAFSHAYTTTKDRPTPALAKKINTWIESTFPESRLRVRYEAVYKTVNFYAIKK